MPTPHPTRTVLEHRMAVLELVRPAPEVVLPVGEADGLVLAADVVAATHVPPWDNSAMDGYAVRADDVAPAGDAPVRLAVVADLPAGSGEQVEVAPGTAARIMTGAPVPRGADAVVPVELTDGGTDAVEVREPVARGAHVRRAGEDAAAGGVVLRAGTLLRPVHVAAAVAAGAGQVLVHRRPVVAVLATGSELVAAGTVPGPGCIPDSNSHLLAAAVRSAGGTALRLDPVPDDPDALREVLVSLDGTVDLVLTSGGVSVGAYDVVKQVFVAWGSVGFARVAMQPGKPQALGTLPGGTPLVGLPGNPVSVHVSFEVFVRPALRRLRGLVDEDPASGAGTVTAVALEDWRSPAGRVQYMPVALSRADGGLGARPASRGGSGSHLVTGLARADGLAVVAAEVDAVRVGDVVTVMRSDLWD